MARGNRANPRYDTSMYQPTEGEILKPVPLFDLSGMDRETPLAFMPPGKCRLVRNLQIRYGAYRTRDGTDTIGTLSTSQLLYATDVVLSDGTSYLVRWRVDGVDVYADGAWHACSGDSWSGENTASFAITGWADTVIFVAGDGQKLFELAFTAGFPLTELTDSPTDVIHLTTFSGRIVASSRTQILWSVKNDNTDWNGLGSGFEDLLSAPGGKPDQQTAVIPITDEAAYCVRSNSVWQMGLTGDFDSPFSFSRVFTYVGSKYPSTVVAIPRGVMFLGDGQIWQVTPDGFQDIAPPIVSYLDTDAGFLRTACAAYDVKFDEYRLSLPSDASITAHKILRYARKNQAWTEDVYPFPVRALAYTQFARGLSIDELTGSIDSLVGQIDDLGVGVRGPGCVYAMANDARWVVRDDFLRNNDATRDVNFSGARVASGFRLETGDAPGTDPIFRKDVTQLILWHEAESTATLDFDYSYDGGTVWALMSQKGIVATTRSRPVAIDRYADREFFQFAVSCEATPTVKLINFLAMGREGARIVDAS